MGGGGNGWIGVGNALLNDPVGDDGAVPKSSH